MTEPFGGTKAYLAQVKLADRGPRPDDAPEGRSRLRRTALLVLAGFLLLCLNIVVGMISRAAPALNLFSVGLPASLAVGVVALAVAFPAMGDYMQVVIHEGLAATSSLVLGR